MPYARNEDLPDSVKNALPAEAQRIWRTIYNSAEKQYDDEARRFQTAWAGLQRAGWRKKADGTWEKVEKARIVKLDSDRQHIFGWASVAVAKDGTLLEDFQGDVIDTSELEQAAYQFVLEARESGVMHQGEAVGQMIESFMVTPEKLEALGLPQDALPQGWWVGFHLPDQATFAKVKAGDYAAFSIEGTAIREAL